MGTAGSKPPEKLKSGPTYFDATGLEITQHEVVSKDGTMIPYFQVGRKGLKCDGTNSTLLYGYGGFEVFMTPSYKPKVGAAGVEEGGGDGVADLRGGGGVG